MLGKQVSFDTISSWPYVDSIEREYMQGNLLTYGESDVMLSTRQYSINEEKLMPPFFGNQNVRAYHKIKRGGENK